MGEFFHGWRRKIGVLTLGIACVLITAWMRSSNKVDEYRFGSGHQKSFVLLRASSEGIACERQDSIRGVIFIYNPGLAHFTIIAGMRFGVSGLISPEGDSPSFDGTHEEFTIVDRKAFGFAVAERRVDFGERVLESESWIKPNKYRLTEWKVPWWAIILPLTLISAWLLLTTPRTPTQKPTEPTATIGA